MTFVSFGELVSAFRNAALSKSHRLALTNIFPEISGYDSFVYRARGKPCHSREEWERYRLDLDKVTKILENIYKQIKSGKRSTTPAIFPIRGMSPINRFFDWMIPELEKDLDVLYPDHPEIISTIMKSFRDLYSKLVKIRQYFNKSNKGEDKIKDFSEDIDIAIKEFNESLVPESKGWRILRINSGPTMKDLSALIKESNEWKNRLKNSFSKKGRPVKPFSILIFSVVKWTSFMELVTIGESIEKGRHRKISKNWQLACATLLWLHVNIGIPEMVDFIRHHESEKPELAIKKLVRILQKEYQNFRRSGKGTGKYEPTGSSYSRYFIGRSFFFENELGPMERRF